MEGYAESQGSRFDTISADLAFVEERLVRFMAEPHLDTSLGPTLDRLRELREMVAAIQAKHTEVTFAWTRAAAAARGQACCLHYLKMLRAAAATAESWPHSHEPVQAEGTEAAPFKESSFSGFESLLPFLASGSDPTKSQPLTPRGSPSDHNDPGSSSELNRWLRLVCLMATRVKGTTSGDLRDGLSIE
ncbi:hypothetical protein Emed_002008 [Eimeria media]